MGAALVYTSSTDLRRKDAIIICCGLGMRAIGVSMECTRNPFVLAFHDGINTPTESQKRPRLHALPFPPGGVSKMLSVSSCAPIRDVFNARYHVMANLYVPKLSQLSRFIYSLRDTFA